MLQGFWTYEVCPGRLIRQFHLEGGKVTLALSLGAAMESFARVPLGQVQDHTGDIMQQTFTGTAPACS